MPVQFVRKSFVVLTFNAKLNEIGKKTEIWQNNIDIDQYKQDYR